MRSRIRTRRPSSPDAGADLAAAAIARRRAEGRASGEARAVLLVLEARGVELAEATRDRILGCTDLDQLEHWLRRAAIIDSVDELFE
jgi:hypothetical protein